MKSMEEFFNEEATHYDNNFINVLGMSEYYDEIEKQLNQCVHKYDILVLGCGTGLEIERIKSKSNVTAIDISKSMVDELQKKDFSKEINLNTIVGSYFDVDFGIKTYDIVLSSYSFHHFNKEQKLFLYAKIYNCLKENGRFIHGDSVAATMDDELTRLKEADKIYADSKFPFGSIHIDVPLTIQSEFLILRNAGFTDIKIEKEWGRTTLYKAKK
ncbi:MAG: methyltransferase family protein [Anaerocolumna sp.]|nr:methyltransferase family protein [Anaerocolumna sp.]